MIGPNQNSNNVSFGKIFFCLSLIGILLIGVVFFQNHQHSHELAKRLYIQAKDDLRKGYFNDALKEAEESLRLHKTLDTIKLLADIYRN